MYSCGGLVTINPPKGLKIALKLIICYKLTIFGADMNRNRYFFLILTIFPTFIMANEITDNFKFASPYFSNIDKQVNTESINAQNLVKKTLSASDFTIPQDWRLVSSVSESNGFRMFFQARNNDVYSFVIDKQGHLSPNTMIHIKSK